MLGISRGVHERSHDAGSSELQLTTGDADCSRHREEISHADVIDMSMRVDDVPDVFHPQPMLGQMVFKRHLRRHFVRQSIFFILLGIA
ncbi:hypothetical protein D3C79_926740 [compost metagenome]